MEMAQVRYFLALCEEANFTRAARRCGVAQPSLTRAIGLLEQELGGRLFRRRVDGSQLTELGSRLEPYFAAIWRYAQEIRQEAKPQSAVRLHGEQSAGAAATAPGAEVWGKVPHSK